MKLKLILAGLAAAFGITSFALGCKKDAKPSAEKDSVEEICLPAYTSEDAVVKRLAYTLQYNEDHEQADWVAYVLTAEEVQGNITKKWNFREDPLVKTGSAKNSDYVHSEYSRGHLAPAADMKWSIDARYDSYYYSNANPQKQDFNNGIWKKLETQVRAWAIENKEILVVTGPVLRDGLPTLKNEGRVSIPEYFYKVIVDLREPDLKGVGYVMAHIDSDQPLEAFAVTIDSVEVLTGIDFFPGYP